jgi:Aerotolerance regulator N-terminal/von Willebrand factor type A domain
VGFLSPWFLAGIAAVGLPLYVHLLRQYKQTPQPFSSLMFFERRVQSSVKHRRLRYLMLLAARLLLLVLLALAFANPFVNRTSATVTRRKLTVIAIDRSFSMREADRMAQAKIEAHRILNGIGGREPVQIIGLDSNVENLSQPESDHAGTNAAIDSIQPGDRASSFGELTRALRVMDQSSGMRLDAHLISDMQQSSMPANFRDLQLGPHTSLTLHRVGTPKAANWAVEGITTAAHIYDPKLTRLTATVAGWQTTATVRTVSLVLDGKTAASKQVNVPPNGRAEVQFTGFEVPYGAHRGEIRMTPGDALPQDDVFPFSVTRSDPSRVLFLYSGNRGQQAFYYKSAMESDPASGVIVQPLSLDQADHTDFSKYAYVVLNDPGELDRSIAQALCGYVSRGGAVLVAIGPNTIAAGRVPLSSDHISGTHQIQGAGFVDEQHPAVVGTGHFENVQFSQAAWITPKPTARVIAKLANGSPLLLDEHMGEGRALIFASTLDNSSSDLPLHTSFVAFVVQSGHYLAGLEDTNTNLTVGTPVTLRHTRDQTTAADVIGPDGKHALSLSEATSALTYDLAQNGFYDVQRADGRRVLFAVHTDRRESDLTTAPQENLDLWRNTGITANGNRNPVQETGTREQLTRPWSLWRYALVLVLIAALVESIFASRYLKEERQTA